VYFVTKGTIHFTLGTEYDNKEIREIKKNNNFGEIEMCLNTLLMYNIKVKTKACELFVFKKEDFLKVSMRYREFIHKFLQKSLMIFLRYSNDAKNIIYESTSTKQIPAMEKNLDSIREESEHNSEKLSKANSSLTVSDEDEPEERMNDASSILKLRKLKTGGVNSPIKKLNESPRRSNKLGEVDRHIEKLKDELYQSFSAQVDKVIKYLNEKGVLFDNSHYNEDPIIILNKLRDCRDINERNILLESLDFAVSKIV
jgi:hypothetical protein